MALTKTTAIDLIDAWRQLVAGTAEVGSAKSLADSFSSILYIEVALASANAQEGVQVLVEVSYADDDWQELITLTGTAETPATTTLNGAVTATDTSITLTDAATGDFDVPGRKWFIEGNTEVNSESVRTLVENANVVGLMQDVKNSYDTGNNVYDRVDEWIIDLPLAASQVRTSVINNDADANVYWTSRISKVTAVA